MPSKLTENNAIQYKNVTNYIARSFSVKSFMSLRIKFLDRDQGKLININYARNTAKENNNPSKNQKLFYFFTLAVLNLLFEKQVLNTLFCFLFFSFQLAVYK